MSAQDLSPIDAERLRAFERRGHDALAISYNDFFAPVTALAAEPLLEAVRLRPGIYLLDLATGPGALAARAASWGARSIGIDLSPRMIELARRLHTTGEYREADAEHLTFADCMFDAIVCSFGLGHFPRPAAVLTECLRVLKPGGRIALSWWDHPVRQRIQGLFREAISEFAISSPDDLPQAHDVLRFCDTDAFLELLNGAEFVEVAVAEHATTYSVCDTETLWHGGLGSFVLTGAMIRHQDKRTQEKIRGGVRAPRQCLQICRRTELASGVQSRLWDEANMNAPIADRSRLRLMDCRCDHVAARPVYPR